MGVNKYQPHVLIIPEDHADEQIANGFVLHDQVKNLDVERPAAGWSGVLEKFKIELVPYLNKYKEGRVILLIDFDNKYPDRRDRFDKAIPDHLKDRVFVLGVKATPEVLKQSLGKDFETIGNELAENCYKGVDGLWTHDHLAHNDPDRVKLIQSVWTILFPKVGKGDI